MQGKKAKLNLYIANLTKEKIINNVLFGITYGYPECCIKYFHTRMHNGDLEKHIAESQRRWLEEGEVFAGDEKLRGTGYICCPECNKNHTEEELVENINKRRLRTEPFPLDQDDTLDEGKLENLDQKSIGKLIEEVIEDIEQHMELPTR